MSKASFAWLSAAGLGFWFFVGFPFGNHNESYYWVARFAREHAWDIIWTKTLAATPRPLGQALAYAGWQLSGGSGAPVQIFNFILAALALRAVALAIPETRTFAAAAVVVGGSFFSGYIYLFHLHGIFYSPVLALVAALLYFRQAEELPPSLTDFAAFACALAVGLLFHPYALIVFLGYVAGLAIERWQPSSSTDRLRQALFAMLAVSTLAAARPRGHSVLSSDHVRALLASYALTELTPVLAALSAVFAAATLLGIPTMSRGLRFGLAAAALLCSLVLVVVGFPVVPLWIAAAIFKTAYRGEWSLSGMTGAAALLPIITTSGSPTYAIFAILMSTIALARGSLALERTLERLSPRWIVVALLFAGLVAGVLRMGVEIPLVSRLAQPLLAEREKTGQLEAVIDWMLASEYRSWDLALEASANPVDAGRDSVDRRRRPPTYQGYLDAYLASRRDAARDHHTLVVTFGTRGRDDMTLVKTVPGRFAGAVMVFR